MKRAAPAVLLALAALAIAGAAMLAVPVLRAQQPPAPPAADSPIPTSRTQGADDPMFVSFEGDPMAGQRVVMGAGGNGVGGACFSCHGLQGEGDGGAGFPRLAGQPAYYLYKQLRDYANGSRPNQVMTPIAARLSEQERRDVAAYFAAARAAHRPTGASADAQVLQRGGSIAAVGSPERGVQSCNGCHGPAGSGLPPDTPYLAGLGAPYMELQLRLWSEGVRTNDPAGMMADVARRLTPQERSAVSQYFNALPAPGQP